MSDHSQSFFHILQYIAALREIPEPASLKRLIDALRVRSNDEAQINANITQLIEILHQHPNLASSLANFIIRLLDNYKQILFYADMGIASDDGFAYSIRKLIGHRFLPLLSEKDALIELIDYLFDQPNDKEWLGLISMENWENLISLIQADNSDLQYVAIAKNGVLNALIILSYRINGIGLHPDIIATHPAMTITAIFTAQNQEVLEFVDNYRKLHNLDTLIDTKPEQDADPSQLLVMLDQCQTIVDNIRKRIYQTGISIRMTNMLVRLEQSILRMRLLLDLLQGGKIRNKAIISLIQNSVCTAKTRYSFGWLIQNNTKLLSQKITENASRVGEHYISTDKVGYQKMYQKAALGGLFIGFMATLKTLSYELTLAPIGRAFVNSMIYGLGFVSIHVVGGTVATKQPAMTAAAIASTIKDDEDKKGRNKQLTKLAELIVDIMRTQFIAIIGNISIAMPVAFMVAYFYGVRYGQPMIDTHMAGHLLHDLDPLRSLSLPHAAIAGVLLFLAGLISGYYDNLAIHNKIGERIKHHKLLAYLLPKNSLDKFSQFVEANLGAIMGNFIFGCFLGSTGTVGYILGLPLDIRHIAFASANFVHGLYFISKQDLTWGLAIYSFIGVLLIGLINLLVSFSLSLMVALRSKEVRYSQGQELFFIIVKHLITSPLNFFIPRNQSVKYDKLDSEGRIIFDEVTKETQIPHHSAVRRLSLKKAESTQTNTNENNAKTSLPKPDKPPQLPK